MDFASILSTILPSLLKLLSDPAFQAIIKAVEDDLSKKIASGASPTAATQQATGLLGAAAMLHLTGNPVADFQTLLAGFKPAATAGQPTTFPP